MADIKITLEKKELGGDSTVYFTNLFGVKITLSRRLVESLRATKKLAKEITVGDDWRLTAQTVEKGGKTYTNFYFSIPKAPDTDEEIPF